MADTVTDSAADAQRASADVPAPAPAQDDGVAATQVAEETEPSSVTDNTTADGNAETAATAAETAATAGETATTAGAKPTTYLVVDIDVTCDAANTIEPEVLVFAWTVYDATNNQIDDVQERIVRPSNLKSLSQFCTDTTGVTNAMLDVATSLDGVIQEITTYFAKRDTVPTVVTDGPADLCQFLLPEAARKQIGLPDFLYYYIDLRQEYARFAATNADSVKLTDMTKEMAVDIEGRRNGEAECRRIHGVLSSLLARGHILSSPQRAEARPIPVMKNVSSQQQVSGNDRSGGEPAAKKPRLDQPGQTAGEKLHPRAVRLRGLPFQATRSDIFGFLASLSVSDDGIIICETPSGRATGIAYVVFDKTEDVDRALLLNGQKMGRRYIEVDPAVEEHVESARQGLERRRELQRREGGFVARLRGLPFGCTTEEILEFLRPTEPIPDGIYLPQTASGRPSGEAFVQFASEDQYEECLRKHKQMLGHRYIEVFPSSLVDMRRASNTYLARDKRERSPRGYDSYGPPRGYDYDRSRGTDRGSYGDGYYGSAHGRGASQRLALYRSTPVIRVRGLPWDATEADIDRFFADFRIAEDGVQLVYNHSGRPSGEAYVAFASREDADRALSLNGQYIGRRYVDLFRATASDMARACSLDVLPEASQSYAYNPHGGYDYRYQQQDYRGYGGYYGSASGQGSYAPPPAQPAAPPAPASYPSDPRAAGTSYAAGGGSYHATGGSYSAAYAAPPPAASTYDPYASVSAQPTSYTPGQYTASYAGGHPHQQQAPPPPPPY